MKVAILFWTNIYRKIVDLISYDASKLGITIIPITIPDPSEILEGNIDEYDTKICSQLSECDACIVMIQKEMNNSNGSALLWLKRSKQIHGGRVQSILFDDLDDIRIPLIYIPSDRQFLDWKLVPDSLNSLKFETELTKFYEENKSQLFKRFLSNEFFSQYKADLERIYHTLKVDLSNLNSGLPKFPNQDCAEEIKKEFPYTVLSKAAYVFDENREQRRPLILILSSNPERLDKFMHFWFWERPSSELFVDSHDFDNCKHLASSLVALLAARVNDYRNGLLSNYSGPIKRLENSPELFETSEYEFPGQMVDMILNPYSRFAIDGGRFGSVYIHRLDALKDPFSDSFILHPALWFFMGDSISELRGLQFVVSVLKSTSMGRTMNNMAGWKTFMYKVDLDEEPIFEEAKDSLDQRV